MSSSSETGFVDYYDVLGIQPNAHIPEIRRAYILKAKQHHPDAGGSTETMQRLNQAYKTLTSATAKAAYDMVHNFHIGSTTPGDYRYEDGREIHNVSDMSDKEVDTFLDNIFQEYRHGAPKTNQGIRHWIRKFF